MKSLTLALLIAAVANVPAAEAVFFPLSLQPGGPLQAGLPYSFRISPATVVGDTAVMLQAVVRGRLELDATAMVAAGNVVDVVLDQIGNTVIALFTFRDFTDHPHIEIVYEVAPQDG